MDAIRIYVDTSVFGGVYDDEFSDASRCFFEDVKQGQYSILISSITFDELQDAPDNVRQILASLPSHAVEELSIDTETRKLANAYIVAGVLSKTMENDALHVAAASVARADVILSWNFKHIVNFKRIQKFNGVNLMNGYCQIRIHSPLEMQDDD